jgi:hypothetical protein
LSADDLSIVVPGATSARTVGLQAAESITASVTTVSLVIVRPPLVALALRGLR